MPGPGDAGSRVGRNAQLVAELRELADRDPLTGLLNHRAFYEALELARQCLKTGEPLAVLVADIDDFKAHNDEYGHLHGDETLRRVARALMQLTRSGDIAGRIGGDEFALAFPNTSGADVEVIAQRLITSLQDTAGLSASVGIAVNPTSSQSYPRDRRARRQRPSRRQAYRQERRPDRRRGLTGYARPMTRLDRQWSETMLKTPAGPLDRVALAFDRCGRGAVRGATMGTIGLPSRAADDGEGCERSRPPRRVTPWQ